MAQSLKVSIFSTAGYTDTSLNAALSEIEGARIVSEIGTVEEITSTLNQTRPDVLMVALGSEPAQDFLEQLAGIIGQHQDLSVIVAAPKRDPDLLLTAMRAGVREFVELPIAAEQLLEVLQKIIETKPARRLGKCVVVHGSGGGCGTSTVACNLAVEMARNGVGSVALMDLDLQMGQLAAMLDLPPTHSLLDLCRLNSDEMDPAQIEKVLLEHPSGLRLVARPRELTAEDLPAMRRTVGVLHHLLESFDYVVVDWDLRQEFTEGQLISMVDTLVLITQPVINSVRNCAHIIKILTGLGFDPERLKLVLNRVPKKLGLLRKENIEKNLGAKIFWEVPEEYDVVTGSINMGVPLSEHAASSKVRSSIRELAAAVASSSGPVHAETRREKDGFLKKLFPGSAPVTN